MEIRRQISLIRDQSVFITWGGPEEFRGGGGGGFTRNLVAKRGGLLT